MPVDESHAGDLNAQVRDALNATSLLGFGYAPADGLTSLRDYYSVDNNRFGECRKKRVTRLISVRRQRLAHSHGDVGSRSDCEVGRNGLGGGVRLLLGGIGALSTIGLLSGVGLLAGIWLLLSRSPGQWHIRVGQLRLLRSTREARIVRISRRRRRRIRCSLSSLIGRRRLRRLRRVRRNIGSTAPLMRGLVLRHRSGLLCLRQGARRSQQKHCAATKGAAGNSFEISSMTHDTGPCARRAPNSAKR